VVVLFLEGTVDTIEGSALLRQGWSSKDHRRA